LLARIPAPGLDMSSPSLRLLAASAAAALLGGCSSPALLPPAIPSGPQLEAYAKSDFAPAVFMGATPRDTLIIGIAYVDQRCAEFFDAVEQMNRRAELIATGLASATTQTAIIMTAAQRSALDVARVAGALEVTRAILNEYKEQFTFAPHSSQLRSIVVQAMTAQRFDYGDVLAGDKRFSQVDAVAAIKKYAENCTLGAIREHWNNAVAKAVREGVQPDIPVAAQAAPSGAFALRARPPAPANILGVNRYVVR
jgi:hypothetical protein